MADVAGRVERRQSAQRLPRRRVVIAGAIVVILIAALVALVLLRGVDTQLRDVTRNHEIRAQARELVQRILDAESGQRGYLLTVDPLYLVPYKSAMAALDETYTRLVDGTADRPSLRARIERVKTALDDKRTEMESTIALAGTGKLDEAIAIVRSDEGRVLTNRIRDAVAAFVAEEDAALVERNAAMDGYRNGLVAALLVALSGAAVLGYLLFNRAQTQVISLARTHSTLLGQKEDLERAVRERTSELEEARAHAERERERVEALLQDTNHRIGNSLATVSSLLGLQMNRSRSDEVKAALEAARVRVQAIASGHRRLRLGTDLETTQADEFLADVVEDLRSALPAGGRIGLDTRLETLTIPARDATTLGIMVGELVTNAVKHAFPDDRSGRVVVVLETGGEGTPLLAVEDDGAGLAPESGDAGGLGATIIRQLALQFGGEPHYMRGRNGGTRVEVSLPGLGRREPDAG